MMCMSVYVMKLIRRAEVKDSRRKEYSVARIDIYHTFLSYEYEFPDRHREV